VTIKYIVKRESGLTQDFFVITINSMKKKQGAPKKSAGKAKGELLQLRVNAAEKQAFAAAAELDGKKMSEWIRDRLRRLSRQELEAADKQVPFLV
jgi:hypothetical protein